MTLIQTLGDPLQMTFSELSATTALPKPTLWRRPPTHPRGQTWIVRLWAELPLTLMVNSAPYINTRGSTLDFDITLTTRMW